MIKTTLHYIVSFSLIWLSLFVGQSIQAMLGISIPGSIIGMLILFSLLVSGIVRLEWVKPGASLFIRYMILLFVPISVGLMDHFELLIANALPIVASVVGGSFLVLIVLGLWLEKFLNGEKR